MHEMAIVASLVDHVSEAAGDARVLRVVVEIGTLTAVALDAFRFSFDVCAKGTPLENAELVIESISAEGICAGCDARIAVQLPITFCDCGSSNIRAVRGHELRIREVEVV